MAKAAMSPRKGEAPWFEPLGDGSESPCPPEGNMIVSSHSDDFDDEDLEISSSLFEPKNPISYDDLDNAVKYIEGSAFSVGDDEDEAIRKIMLKFDIENIDVNSLDSSLLQLQAKSNPPNSKPSENIPSAGPFDATKTSIGIPASAATTNPFALLQASGAGGKVDEIGYWNTRVNRREVYDRGYQPSRREQDEIGLLAKFLGIHSFPQQGENPLPKVWTNLVPTEAQARSRQQPMSILLKRGPVKFRSHDECELIFLTRGFIVARRNFQFIPRFQLAEEWTSVQSVRPAGLLDFVISCESAKSYRFHCRSSTEQISWLEGLRTIVLQAHSGMHSSARKRELEFGWQYRLVYVPLFTEAVTNDLSTFPAMTPAVKATLNDLDSYNSYAPLHYAVRANNAAAIRALLEAGAYVNVGDVYGRTPIYYAELHQVQDSTIQLLEFYGAQSLKVPTTKVVRVKAHFKVLLVALFLLSFAVFSSLIMLKMGLLSLQFKASAQTLAPSQSPSPTQGLIASLSYAPSTSHFKTVSSRPTDMLPSEQPSKPDALSPTLRPSTNTDNSLSASPSLSLRATTLPTSASTLKPTTQEPITQEPTTQEPTTQEPITQEPTTQEPTTQEPTTQEPTTQEPTTQEPTTQEPSNPSPTAFPTNQPSTDFPSSTPPLSQPPTVLAPNSQATFELFQLLASVSFDSGAALSSYFSAQNQAFRWLLDNSNLWSYSDEKKIQRYALATLYKSTLGENWLDNIRWMTDEDECTWFTSQGSGSYSVCSANKIFLVLDLGFNNLQGTIPPQIALLTGLRAMDLSGGPSGFLTGTLPTQIGLLTKLETFSVRGNKMTGTVPSQLGGWVQARRLDLSLNSFSGQLPSSFGLMQGLSEMSVANNGFTGAIPKEIGTAQSLFKLNLAGNFFSGAIPIEVFSLTDLRYLYMENNELSALPSNIGQLKYLTVLSLFNNNIQGPLPSEIGNLSKLGTLLLNHNSFQSSIPSEIGSLVELMGGIDLSFNLLSGTIPTEIGRITLMRSLRLQSNQLSGFIPTEVAKLSLLNTLRIDSNDLVGTVPDEVCEVFLTTYPNFYADCSTEVSCSCCTYCCVDETSCTCAYFGTADEYLC